jgi:hypothetical protein
MIRVRVGRTFMVGVALWQTMPADFALPASHSTRRGDREDGTDDKRTIDLSAAILPSCTGTARRRTALARTFCVWAVGKQWVRRGRALWRTGPSGGRVHRDPVAGPSSLRGARRSTDDNGTDWRRQKALGSSRQVLDRRRVPSRAAARRAFAHGFELGGNLLERSVGRCCFDACHQPDQAIVALLGHGAVEQTDLNDPFVS